MLTTKRETELFVMKSSVRETCCDREE